MQKLHTILTATAAACILAAVPAANASFTINASVGGNAISGATKFNFDSLTSGSAASATVSSVIGGSTVDVSFIPDGQAITGAASGLYAAPYLSPANGVGFATGGGDQTPGTGTSQGVDTSVYLTTGTGSAILKFNSDQNYLGLLWGSVDNYNKLSFYLNGQNVGDVTGSQVKANANGDQGINGTVYANIFTGNQMFDTVVATSTQYAFEFDNVAVAAVPEPSTIIAGALLLLPFGVSTLRSLRRNRE